jgi:hypothetical protein
MSNFVEINGDPDYIRARGAMLAATGETFDGKAKSLVGRINGIEAGAPWGPDDFGDRFKDNGEGGGYNGTENIPDGKQFHEFVQTSASGIGPQMTKTGNAIQSAMTGYQFADFDNSADIENA